MDESTTPKPPPRRSKARVAAYAVGGVLLCMLLGLVLMIALAWHLLRTESGTRQLLPHIPYVAVTNPRGALAGDFEAERVLVTLPGDGGTVTLQSVGWRGLALSRESAPGTWLKVMLDDLHAARVELAMKSKPGPGEPMKPPTDLRLPVEVELKQLTVGEIATAALGPAPLRDLRARIHLAADGGTLHRIEGLHLARDPVVVDGAATIATTAPFALDVKLAVDASKPPQQLQASATLTGPLAQPLLVAKLAARADAKQDEQTATARATLAPFAAWPLSTLEASTTSLDLSALVAGAPITSLTGTATAKTAAADQPIVVQAEMVNERAGAWDQSRVPVRRLSAEVQLKADDPSHLTIDGIDVDLGTQAAAAGQLQGKGMWAGDRWNFEATLQAVAPSKLDARAPAMLLSGPITLEGTGFDKPAEGTVEVKADIAGRLADAGPVRDAKLHAAATLNARRIDIHELDALAGNARATLQGTATHADDTAPWVVQAKAALAQFDPAVWWPGLRAAKPHRLNAKLDVDLTAPIAAQATPWQQLAALRGRANLAMADSVLAGVPLAADIKLRAADGRSIAATAKVDAGGNQVDLDGQLAATASGEADRWTLKLAAPALAALSPITRLFGAGDLSGAAQADARLSGRWPAISTQGDLKADAIKAGAASVQQAVASWQVALVPNGTTNVNATLTQAMWTDPKPPAGSSGRRVIESVQARVEGTARAHTIALDATSGALPPAWTDALMAPRAPTAATRSIATLRAEGGFVEDRNAAAPLQLAGWQGRLKQLDLHPSTAPDAPWLSIADVALASRWAPSASVDVQAGRAQVLGGAISWSRIAWAAATGGQPQRIAVDAEMEPLKIAPLLARIQPTFGWSGDLAIGGHVHLHSAPTVTADVVIERSGGDLSVTDDLGTTALGLTNLRLALNAKDGTWNLTEAIAGRIVGTSGGAVVVRTSPEALVPTEDAPISGTLELRVADLGALGSFVPTGWRLAGALHASAGIAGRVGAPEYTGEVTGTQLGVRNFLQGVNVTDGDMRITLKGLTAHVDRFTAKAGAGTLKLEGDASFGESPNAALVLSADHFQLLSRVDRKVAISGRSDIRLKKDAVDVGGKFEVDNGLIDVTRSDAPSLGDDVTITRASTRTQDAPAAKPANDTPTTTARALNLDLQVGLGQQLRLRGHGIDTGLRGDLRVTSPGGKLSVVGVIRTEGGTYNAYRQKLTIDRGAITFSGAVDNPQLDILATRSDTDVKVGVIVTGSAAEPRVRLYSNPEVSDMDKLSWLVLGRASDGLGSTDMALLQQAALAILAGDGPSKTDEFTKAIGLDDIGIKQTDDTSGNKQTVVALGKQLSRRWYLGYEKGLSATMGSFQLVYRLAQRFTVRAQSGADNSLDVIWTVRWH